MFRALFYLLCVAVIGLGFAWLANYPGELTITLAGTRITSSVLTAGVALFALFVIILFLLWVVKSIIRAPFMLKRHLHNRKKDHGYQLLSAGLIAAFAGDGVTARRMAHKSGKLLDGKKELLLPFLEAQTKLLDLDDEGAIKLFETMRGNPQTQALALKGLYRAALDSGAKEAAAQYAAEAAALNPGLKWASLATLDHFAALGKWSEAQTLFDSYSKAQPKTVARSERQLQQRVVLMTGQAQDLLENQPDEARHLALKAHKLLPSFVPAANIAARILFTLEETRKGSRLIEAIWQKTPHPDLGLTYINAKGGETAAGRLKRASQLARYNPDHRESRLLVARTAYEAGELALARSHAEHVAETAPTESVFLLLADIETAQTGDQGNIRRWLAKAVQAEPDMAWIADDISLPQWQPVSPLSGHLGGCVWRTPSKRPAGLSPAAHEAADKNAYAAQLPAFSLNDTADKAEKQRSSKAKDTVTKPAAVAAVTILDMKPVHQTDVPREGEKNLSPEPLTRLVVDDPGVSDDNETIK